MPKNPEWIEKDGKLRLVGTPVWIEAAEPGSIGNYYVCADGEGRSPCMSLRGAKTAAKDLARYLERKAGS